MYFGAVRVSEAAWTADTGGVHCILLVGVSGIGCIYSDCVLQWNKRVEHEVCLLFVLSGAFADTIFDMCKDGNCRRPCHIGRVGGKGREEGIGYGDIKRDKEAFDADNCFCNSAVLRD